MASRARALNKIEIAQRLKRFSLGYGGNNARVNRVPIKVLADFIGCERTSLYNIIHGTSSLSEPLFRRLCVVLNRIEKGNLSFKRINNKWEPIITFCQDFELTGDSLRSFDSTDRLQAKAHPKPQEVLSRGIFSDLYQGKGAFG